MSSDAIETTTVPSAPRRQPVTATTPSHSTGARARRRRTRLLALRRARSSASSPLLLFWNQTRRDIADAAENQRQFAADLDAARGVSNINVAGAPALGPANQVVTLVEFSDYECPFCVRHFSQTMAQIQEQFIGTGRIRYVFKDFPIDQLHPGIGARPRAARCAGEQGKFWEMHMRMFSPPGSHTDAALEAQAAAAGVAAGPFRECLASGRNVEARGQERFDRRRAGGHRHAVVLRRPAGSGDRRRADHGGGERRAAIRRVREG